MATYHFVADTAKSPTEVFEFFADMRNAPTWDPSITSVVRLDDGAVRLGSTFRVALGFVGRSLLLEYVVANFDVPHRVVLRAESKFFISEDTISVAAMAGGATRVTYEASLVGKGATVVLDSLFKLSINHFGKRAGAKLREGYLR